MDHREVRTRTGYATSDNLQIVNVIHLAEPSNTIKSGIEARAVS